jgi:NADH-quinone oxidoreductase subunit N
MSTEQLVPLLPFIVISATTVILMMVIALCRNHDLTVRITITGLLLTLATLFLVFNSITRSVSILLFVDNFSLYYLGLVIVGSLFVAVMAHCYFSKRDERPDEFYLLLLMASLGSAILVAANHFVAVVLGLEVLSVSLYAMIAYTRQTRHSIEAGIKYLVLAAGSAVFLLFGMALIYAETGTMEFTRILLSIHHAGISPPSASLGGSVLILGMALLVVGIGFKLAVAPFHMWTPDVYQGACAPTTAFVATVSKGAMFAVLLRFFSLMDVQSRPGFLLVFVIVAVASMTGGNLLALMQSNVKRILAYSSIANLGYLLVAFVSSGSLASTAAAYYLAAYFAALLGSFCVIIYISADDREADMIDDFRGLFWRRPWVAAAFTTMMFSLAGIPLTAGFIGKFFVLAAGGQSARWMLLFAVVLNSTLGLYYYLRVILAMISSPANSGVSPSTPSLSYSRTMAVALSVLTITVAILGIFPSSLLSILNVLLVN